MKLVELVSSPPYRFSLVLCFKIGEIVKEVVAGGVISNVTINSHTLCSSYLYKSAGTLPRKSSEFKSLRASLVSQTCTDQDKSEEKVCCTRDENYEVDLQLK